MDPASTGSPSVRNVLLLIGVIVVFVAGLTTLENLVGPEPTPSGNRSSTATEAAAHSPAPPRLLRADDGAIEIRHDFFRRSTIRMGDEEDDKAVFDCLAQAFEETFGESTEGWTRKRVKNETQRILDACVGAVHDLPVPPPPR